MIPYKFLRDTKVFCSIPVLPYTVVGSSVSRKECDEVSWSAIYGRWIVSVAERMWRSFPEVPYMVVGSSVSWKECDEVFLKCHIWSLDRQCRGKNVTKFSWSAIYGRWIVSVAENMWRSFPKLLLGRDKLNCTRSSNMDREALLRRRRELYRQRRERETPDEKEVRLSGRREYLIQATCVSRITCPQLLSLMHVCMHSQARPSMLLASV